ncbi:MAG: Rrf2 family transcriptional regulator [Sinobacterium sp.]|nr:Rrf2 family transcriptional regulator [Sinobacterium sp.]
MQLTKHTDYAFRVLIFLTGLQGDEKATIAQITQAYDISKSHLMKIVNKLAQNGYIASTRGKSGGIRLAKPPQDISIAEIVELMEPTLMAVNCHAPSCLLSSNCRLESVLVKATQAFIDTLRPISLADVTDESVWQVLELR